MIQFTIWNATNDGHVFKQYQSGLDNSTCLLAGHGLNDVHTVMILSCQADSSGQTGQTQIRLMCRLIRVYTVHLLDKLLSNYNIF